MSRLICLLLPVLLLLLVGVKQGSKKDVDQTKPTSGNPTVIVPSLVDEEGRSDGRVISRSEARQLLFSQLQFDVRDNLSQSEQEILTLYLRTLANHEGSRVSWCLGEDASKAFIEAHSLIEQLAGGHANAEIAGFQFLEGGRWTETANDGFIASGQGEPIIVTWSLVPDGTPAPGLTGALNGTSNLRSWLAGLYGGSVNGPLDSQPWFVLFEEAFEEMESTCGVEFRYESNDDGAAMEASSPGVLGVRGDIRIGARFLDGNSGFLGISKGPDEGDMVLDSGDSTFSLTGGNSLRLVNTLTHELGHCLGLAHVCPVNQTKLMEPSLSTAFRGPRYDEHQSLQRLYGDSLEKHGEFRDNDSVASATPMEVSVTEPTVIPRLSIDDDRDEDFYRVSLLNGQKLQVRVVPGEGTYAEGGEGDAGCSSGVLFNSAVVHDLKITVFDRDGDTILSEVDAFGPGGVEDSDLIEVPRSGDYFVRITGGVANAAQLYRLELSLEERSPGPRLVFENPVVLAESGSVKNGRPDPNETVRVRFPLLNEGSSPSGDLSLALATSNNVTVFEQSTITFVDSGQAGDVELVFAIAGVCGDEGLVEVEVSDTGGDAAVRSYRFDLGELLSPVPIDETFDGGPVLPGDWNSQSSGDGQDWIAVSSRFDTPLRSAFAAGQGSPGEALLVSPVFQLSADGGTLSFRQVYRLEDRFDGGVLEVSRNGGAWTDLIEDHGLLVSGGYSSTIREGFGSAIEGQLAWTGQLSSFMTTSVELPAAWGGENLQFRWRYVSDQSGSSEGWWVDTVKVEMMVDDCVPHRPALTLSLQEGGLDENLPSRQATLLLESELPLLSDFPVALERFGTAGPGDYTGPSEVILTAGTTSQAIGFSVVNDGLVEEEETLVVRLPDQETGFAAGDPSVVVLPIIDREDLSVWISRFGGSVDLTGDQDGDGLSGLGEYLLGTDPTDAGSSKRLVPVLRPDGVLLPLGVLPERNDAALGVERSSDLKTWEPAPFTVIGDGLLVEEAEVGGFLRLTFLQTAGP